MLKNIVFDLGNVIVSFDPDAILEHHVDNPAYRPVLKRDVFSSVEWVMLDRGSISLEAGIERIESRLSPPLKPYVRPLIMNWQDGMQQYPDSLALIVELKAAGVPLYLLSNISTNFRSYQDEIEALPYFNDILISSEYKLLKPDPAIFHQAAEQFSIVPSESVFIDDVAMNVEGAIRAGYSGLVFHKDTARLRRELFDLGFPLQIKAEVTL